MFSNDYKRNQIFLNLSQLFQFNHNDNVFLNIKDLKEISLIQCFLLLLMIFLNKFSLEKILLNNYFQIIFI